MSFQIIILEDQAIVSTLVVNALRRGGYAALPVSTPQEALEALCHGEASLLIADMLLRPASGVQAAVKAVALQPSLKVLFTSGTPMEFWTDEDLDGVCALSPASFAFLMKPFQAGELLTAVEALLRLPILIAGTASAPQDARFDETKVTCGGSALRPPPDPCSNPHLPVLIEARHIRPPVVELGRAGVGMIGHLASLR